MKTKFFITIAALSATLVAGTAGAQVMLQKAVISSGAASSTNGTTNGQITAGQQATGRATNGQTVGQFGFWNGSPAAQQVDKVLALNATGFQFELYPNPTADRVTVSTTLGAEQQVDLRLFDEMGKEVKVIYSGQVQPGTHSFQLAADDLASGTYLIAMRVPNGMLEKPLKVVR